MVKTNLFSEDYLERFIDEFLESIKGNLTEYITLSRTPGLFSEKNIGNLRGNLRDKLCIAFKKIFTKQKNENDNYKILTNGRHFKISRAPNHQNRYKWKDIRKTDISKCGVNMVVQGYGAIALFLNEIDAKTALRWLIQEDEYHKNRNNWVELTI